MYGKRFLAVSRIGVYFAVIALVGVTLFGSIAPASPMLERTKRNLERDGVYFEWRLWVPSDHGEGMEEMPLGAEDSEATTRNAK